ncbi:ribosomal maturation YjgA family protein [Faecalimicrobium sp. JNUCC 81]
MKKRITYFIITISVMFMGLLSRKFMFIFPKSIAPFVGDMFWAMMVYYGFKFLFLKLTNLKSFLVAIIFSFSIEVSQLYQADWINNIRATTLGGLVLGYGFLWEDLISYNIGIVLGVAIDKFVFN